MKRIAFILTVIFALLLLCSCQDTQRLYENKAICVEVSHVSCFEAYEHEIIYLENIERGRTYSLPSGENNPYKVELTVAQISQGGITLCFSQPLDRIKGDESGGWETEIDEFELFDKEPQRFITPTDGGGDIFEFSIVEK